MSNFIVDKDNGVGDFNTPLFDVLFELDEYFVSMKLWPIKYENGCKVVDDQYLSCFLLELDEDEKVDHLQIQDLSLNKMVNVYRYDEDVFGNDKEVFSVYIKQGNEFSEELREYNSDEDILDEFDFGMELLYTMRTAIELCCPYKGLFEEMVRYNISTDARIGNICFEDIYENKDFSFRLLKDKDEE